MCGASYTDEQIETAAGIGTTPYVVSLIDTVFDEIGKRTEGQPNYDPAVDGDVVIPAYAVGVFGKVVAGWMADSARYAQTNFLDLILRSFAEDGEADIPTEAFARSERELTRVDL